MNEAVGKLLAPPEHDPHYYGRSLDGDPFPFLSVIALVLASFAAAYVGLEASGLANKMQ